MAGWQARKDALREKDAKARSRILKDNRTSVSLVERVMAQLHDAAQEPQNAP